MSKNCPGRKNHGGTAVLTVVLGVVLLQPLGLAYGAGPPVVGPGEVTSVLDTSATIRLPMPSTGGAKWDVTIFYGTTDGGTKEDDWQQRLARDWTSDEQGEYSATLESLRRETQYFYRVAATNAEGTTWSDVARFRTESWITPWWIVGLIVLALLTAPFLSGSYLARRLRMPDYAWKIGLIFFSLTSGLAVMLLGWPPKLGIDLSGGVILVYEVDQSKKQDPNTTLDNEQMDQLIGALSERANPGGVREVTIRKFGVEQIEIIVPEADENELRRLKQMLTRVGTLEFRILANTRDHAEFIERAKRENTRLLKDAEGNELGRWVPVKRGQENSFSYPEIATRRGQRGDHDVLEIFVVRDDFNVTGDYLTRAAPGVDRHGQPCVLFGFGSTGARLFGGLTGANLPDKVQDFTRKLGIVLDEELFSAPAIQSTIYDRGEITGSFTEEEVNDLVNVLNAGSLPAALARDPISELLTGPTLGRDTIIRGAWAIAVSMVLVLVFMLIYYRFSGIVACVALLTNLVLILAIMITIKAAFTLPGLAGLVLTVGMAVDANVLIFERIREELARGAALRMAIRNGFNRATTTIVDASLTTLITATVLYWIGTDQVKGFAVTLWLGVVLSMYTAIFCSRVVFDIGEKRRWISRLSMMQMLGRTQIDFLGRRYVAGAMSVLVILVGLVGVAFRGAGLLDIDFTGGVRVEVLFNKPQESIYFVRQALRDLPDLAVSDVQIQDEPARQRFMVNTSQQNIGRVEDFIKRVFPDRLATNSLTVGKPAVIGSDGRATASAREEPARPATGDQTRNDLPDDSVLALADPSLLLLAQADAPEAGPAAVPSGDSAEDPGAKAPEEPATKPDDEPATEPAEAPGTEPAEEPGTKPADEPATEPDGQPGAEPTAESAEEPAPGPDGEAPSEPPAVATSPYAGWAQAELEFSQKVDYETLQEIVAEGLKGAGLDPEAVDFDLFNPAYVEGEGATYPNWTVRIDLPLPKAQQVLGAIEENVANTPFFPSSNEIGSKVAGSTRTAAVAALLASLLGIVIYLWVRFQRVIFGLSAVIALVHDVLVTLGVVALSYWLAPYLGFLLIDPFKIGLPVLAAFLTIIGYSLNDTIVVFDRIREVRGKAPQLTQEMVNTSVNQTLSRTLLTSTTTLLVVLVLYAFGGQAIHGFAFALVVGVLVGTYSSIFVASPALLWMSRPSSK